MGILAAQIEATKQPSLRRRETDSLSHARASGRAMFFEALYRLAPEVSGDLIRATQNWLLQGFVDALANDQNDDGVVTNEVLARDEMSNIVAEWQERYSLTDQWFQDVALTTLGAAFGTARKSGRWPMLDVRTPLVWTFEDAKATPDDGKSRWPLFHLPPDRTRPYGATVIHPLHFIDIPIMFSDLTYTGDEDTGEWGDYVSFTDYDSTIGTFNPRAETIDAAAKRIMLLLEGRLRRVLAELVELDRALPGAAKPVAYRGLTGFERLVRYQVLGESRNEIAAADNVSRATVTEQVNETAALIDLTLRKSRGGRPRRTG
jgi:hypothetical protein